MAQDLNLVKNLGIQQATKGIGATEVGSDYSWDPQYNLTEIAEQSLNARNLGVPGLGGESTSQARTTQLGNLATSINEGLPVTELGDAGSITKTVNNTSQDFYNQNQDFFTGDSGIAGTGGGTQKLVDQLGAGLSQNVNFAQTPTTIPANIQNMLDSPNPGVQAAGQKVVDALQKANTDQSQIRMSGQNQSITDAMLTQLATQANTAPTTQIGDVAVQADKGAISAGLRTGQGDKAVQTPAAQAAEALGRASQGIGNDALYGSASGGLTDILGGTSADAVRNAAITGASGLDTSGMNTALMDAIYSYATRDMQDELNKNAGNLQTYMNTFNLGGSTAERTGMTNLMKEDTRAREGVRTAMAIDQMQRAGEESRANLETMGGLYNTFAGTDINAASQAKELLGAKSAADVAAANAGTNLAGTLGDYYNQSASTLGNLAQAGVNTDLQQQALNQAADVTKFNEEATRKQNAVTNMLGVRQASDTREAAATSQNLAASAAEEQANLARKQLLGQMTTEADQLAQNAAIADEQARLGRMSLGATTAAQATAAATEIMQAENSAQQQAFDQMLASAQFENQAYQQGLGNQQALLEATTNLDNLMLNQGLNTDQIIRGNLSDVQGNLTERAGARTTPLQDVAGGLQLGADLTKSITGTITNPTGKTS